MLSHVEIGGRYFRVLQIRAFTQWWLGQGSLEVKWQLWKDTAVDLAVTDQSKHFNQSRFAKAPQHFGSQKVTSPEIPSISRYFQVNNGQHRSTRNNRNSRTKHHKTIFEDLSRSFEIIFAPPSPEEVEVGRVASRHDSP